MLRSVLSLCVSITLGLCCAAYADEVTPSDSVRTRVVVRAAPDGDAARIGVLNPGETFELTGDTPQWWQVRLDDGGTGFVSKRWTVVLEADATFRVHVADVATGLAIFVEGEDFALVYDAGSNDERRGGENNRFLNYLRAVRPDLTRIDHVILSHAHRDHVELMPDMFDAYEIGEAWDSGAPYSTCGYRQFLARVAAEEGLIFHTGVGETFARTFPAGCSREAETITFARLANIPETRIDLGANAFMSFLYVDAEAHGDPNENSLIVRLDLGETRILLMGDAEAGRDDRRPPSAPADPMSIEGVLVRERGSEIRADILVVGHHGSMTSSRTVFLDAVGAHDFVISSGPFRYGDVILPDQVVVDELERRASGLGGELWRTDRDDTACRASRVKVGADPREEADDRPGGCDNIQITIEGSNIAIAYWSPTP